MGIHEKLKEIINSKKIVWAKVSKLITEFNVNEKRQVDNKTPLQVVLEYFSEIIKKEKKQDLLQDNPKIQLKIQKKQPKKESTKKQSISFKEKQKRCIKIISMLIKKGAKLKICQSLITTEIIKRLFTDLTYEEICSTFANGEFSFGHLSISSKNSKPYIAFANNELESKKVKDETYGIYIDDNTSVGPKFHVSIFPKLDYLKKACNIIKNILIIHDIYSFKFVKYDKAKYIQEGKQFVIYACFYIINDKKNWTEILEEIEKSLKIKHIKYDKKPKENSRVIFGNKQSKYISGRNDYFKEEYYNRSKFFSMAYKEVFKQIWQKGDNNTLNRYLSIILNIMPDKLKMEKTDNLVEILNRLELETEIPSGTPNVLSEYDSEGEDSEEDNTLMTIKEKITKENEKLTKALKAIEIYMRLVEDGIIQDLKQNVKENAKLKLAMQAMKNLEKEGITNDEYEKLKQLIEVKSKKLKCIIQEKIRKQLSFTIKNYNEFDEFYSKNKVLMDFLVKYVCKLYKEKCPIYYISAELASAAAVVLTKNKTLKMKLQPYNPFGFINILKNQSKKQGKVKIKKKEKITNNFKK